MFYMAYMNSQVMKRRHTKRGVMLSVTFRCSHSYKDDSGKPLPRVAYYSVADWVVVVRNTATDYSLCAILRCDAE